MATEALTRRVASGNAGLNIVAVSTQQPPADRPARPRVIKRYANRKLYDTRDSRYVTLQQIAEYVRGGEEVSIIDNTTKEDLTNVTLAQIVYEEERKSGQAVGDDGRRASPRAGALRTLIQQSGERLMSTLSGTAVGKLITRRDATADGPIELDEAVEKVLGTAPAGAAAEKSDDAARNKLLVSPKEAWDELQRLADDRMKAVLGAAITHVHQLQGEVKRLQGRIEELEQKLVAMSARKGDAASADPSDPGADTGSDPADSK
ncbi:MAG: polyhydroxyalkanoate synthesis regulator DNA-binding domain-containing protein [Myxococcota bacterium]|nr:polyhydroxyalkanoate synthesis regulator DNA-binding domain-containing protein [Myxococcota bacterium]